ncbi:DUF4214 domain-containing protein [Thiorhodococcus minor]|uniref:DUF4214 domain-containing protein n=1 Tax=Thiorhodococcus minor TaxID=57489 RepID=A0A6M0JUB2_9GAMM|nr:DUF4214 domain-containing protein [Thiorhodococcus minor]NEV61118.1 DUF4214 domain-containing protein [Thiorhodococcus minor]
MWGAAADAEGADYWVAKIGEGWSYVDVAASFFDQWRVQNEYENSDGSPLAGDDFLTALYQNIFKVDTPDTEGFEYWQGRMAELGVTDYDSADVGTLVMEMIDGMWANEDNVDTVQVLYQNWIEASLQFYDEQKERDLTPFSELSRSDQAAFLMAASDLVDGIDETSTPQDIENAVWTAMDAITSDAYFTLTYGQDNIVGDGLDNTFMAPVVQTEEGVLANTLETGDVVNGAGGVDTLQVDLIDSGDVGDVGDAPAISATTNEVERVFLRQQSPQTDFFVNNSTIDAEKMLGVQEWWSDNSRSGIQIEDIRSIPEQTTFGMRETDPGVSYTAYFDPAQVSEDRLQDIDSSLTLRLEDTANPGSLENFPVDGVIFSFDGMQYTIDLDLGEGAERTYDALLAAVNAGLAAEDALSGLTATLNADNSLTITDPNGGSFEAVGYSWIDDIVPPAGTLNWDLVVGAPVQEDVPIETDVVLDFVGRSSQGGILDIGSMGDGGVNVFNVTVDRSSWLTRMESRSDLGAGDRNLETVNLASGANAGDLTVGTPVEGQTGELDGRVVNGLTDLQTIDGSGFLGELNLGIVLTDDAIDRYLAGATEEVPFIYTGSEQNDNFTIDGSQAVALTGDTDFGFDVLMGGGDDRLNIDLPNSATTTVDGGEGDNVIAVSRSHGDTTDTTFEGFSNFQIYEVEGTGIQQIGGLWQLVFDNTTHDFSSMSGVENVVIATDGVSVGFPLFDNVVANAGDNTTLVDLEDGTMVTVSGKNQTLGDNSNNDQLFGPLQIQGADGETLDIDLDNTARVDGRLRIDSLQVEDEPLPATNESAVRTVNLTSGGERDTVNSVVDFQGERVTALNLDGSQDLGVRITDLASEPVESGETPAMMVNGAALEADLTIGMDAALLDNEDDDTLTATAGDDDVLMLYGTVDTNATISDFDVIQFGKRGDLGLVTRVGSATADTVLRGATGTFDATNTDTGSYVIARLNGDLRLEALSGDITVDIGDDTGNDGQVLAAAAATLEFVATGTPGALNLNVVPEVAAGTFGPGASTVVVEGFETINVDLDRSNSVGPENLFSTLDLNDDARTLTLQGGNEDVAITMELENALNTALTTVDFSEFEGEFRVPLGWDSTEGSNGTIVANEYDFVFDIGGDNTVIPVGVGANTADVGEEWLVTFGVGALADGESITIDFAGSQYVFTNDTGADIAAAAINASIIADAANAPSGFDITANGANIQLTATNPGDMAAAAPVVTLEPGSAVATAQALFTPGELAPATLPYEIVTTLSDFVTTFQFTEDANEAGVVWQIDNFQAFDVQGNVNLGNASVIDLRDLGVDSASDIDIADAATWWGALSAEEQADFDLVANPGLNVAGNTVVTSNEGLDFTILLTGVDWNDLANENFQGIA